jgi:hypothetical protein
MKPVLQSRGTITQAMVLDPLNPRLEFVWSIKENIYRLDIMKLRNIK